VSSTYFTRKIEAMCSSEMLVTYTAIQPRKQLTTNIFPRNYGNYNNNKCIVYLCILVLTVCVCVCVCARAHICVSPNNILRDYGHMCSRGSIYLCIITCNERYNITLFHVQKHMFHCSVHFVYADNFYCSVINMLVFIYQ
jgi:hypothetical protein